MEIQAIIMTNRVIPMVSVSASLLILLVLAIGTYVGRDKVLILLFGPIDTTPVDFPSLDLKPTPNQFLVCPADYCKSPPHLVSPVFDMSVDVLQQRWLDMADRQPRIEPLHRDEQNRQFDIIQRTALMRYPDSITVKFLALPEGRSTLAVYSRSHYGKSDFGVNEERIRNWLENLAQP